MEKTTIEQIEHLKRIAKGFDPTMRLPPNIQLAIEILTQDEHVPGIVGLMPITFERRAVAFAPTRIARGEQKHVTTRPMFIIKPDKLVLPEECASRLRIHEIFVGIEPVYFAPGTPHEGSLFSVAFNGEEAHLYPNRPVWDWPTCQICQDITLSVEAKEDIEFSGFVEGKSILG